MDADNALAPEPPIFSAVLTPHRSLGRTGFIALMIAIGGVSFVAGMVFLIAGAWPVLGFFGLDAALIWFAFRANYRAARAREEVVVTPCELTVRKISAGGRMMEWTLNPLWVRLDRDVHPDFGVQGLFLVSSGRRLKIAGFLGAEEKQSFAGALDAALTQVRRGPTRTVMT